MGWLEVGTAMLSGGAGQSAGPSGADSVGPGSVNIGGSSPIYRAPLLDLGNPAHVLGLAALVVVAVLAVRKLKR